MYGKRTTYTEAANTQGNTGKSRRQSTLPARKNVSRLVRLCSSGQFIGTNSSGRRQADSQSAGTVIRPPPPTMALIKAPRKPKPTSMASVQVSKAPLLAYQQ